MDTRALYVSVLCGCFLCLQLVNASYVCVLGDISTFLFCCLGPRHQAMLFKIGQISLLCPFWSILVRIILILSVKTFQEHKNEQMQYGVVCLCLQLTWNCIVILAVIASTLLISILLPVISTDLLNFVPLSGSYGVVQIPKHQDKTITFQREGTSRIYNSGRRWFLIPTSLSGCSASADVLFSMCIFVGNWKIWTFLHWD